MHHDVLDHGELLLRRVLEGHRPLGELGGGAQPLPVRQVVALDDRPVDVEGVVHPLLVDPVDLLLPATEFLRLPHVVRPLDGEKVPEILLTKAVQHPADALFRLHPVIMPLHQRCIGIIPYFMRG